MEEQIQVWALELCFLYNCMVVGHALEDLVHTRYKKHLLTSGGVGGGTLIVFSYVDLGTASTVHPKIYQEYKAPQKYLKF